MDFRNLAAQVLMSMVEHVNGSGAAGSALDALSPGGNKFDLAEIIDQFSGAGRKPAVKVRSWLGDGENAAISADEMHDVIGSARISHFATKLGVSPEEATSQLTEFLPELIDKSSIGGSLLGNGRKRKGIVGFASRLLGK